MPANLNPNSAIKREIAAPSVPPQSLDPGLFKPNLVERAFLRQTISSDDEVLKRAVFKVQRESYEAYPYPCIRGFHFVGLMMLENEKYSEVLRDGRTDRSAIFLDLGCCMGTDVRKLALDGYPSQNIIGCDVRQSYIDLGHELYADKVTCRIKFMVSDIFDVTPFPGPPSVAGRPSSTLPLSDAQSLHDLTGRAKHIYTGALFHLFNESTQMALALRLVVLLRRTPGAVIFGRHQGFEKEGMVDDWMHRERYAHSPASWRIMWISAFSTVYGEEYAQNNVIVHADLKGRIPGIDYANFRQLVWNVQLRA